MVLIKVLRFFVLTFVLSYLAVWISNRPGTVRIVWQEYLVETNLIGVLLVFTLILFSLLLLIFIFSKIKNLPRNLSSAKKEKFLILGNESLDQLATNLFLGNKDSLEKDSLKLKKYFGNELFSTIILFNSALGNNNLSSAEKHLKTLKSIPKAKYISIRAEIMIPLKANNLDRAIELLSNAKKDYEGDIWISEKLARIYSQRQEWKLAWESVKSVDDRNNNDFNILKANLHAMSGNNVLESLKISDQSIYVTNEAIKQYIKIKDLDKAAKLVGKNWLKYNSLNVIDTFIKFEVINNADSLKRHKLLLKSLKKFSYSSDETKFALAQSAYEAKIWGESQKYLDEISRDNWDERVVNLYENISKKSEKISLPKVPENIKPIPQWYCQVCKARYVDWQFLCDECSSIDKIIWPKDESIKKRTNLLENPFRHFPKME